MDLEPSAGTAAASLASAGPAANARRSGPGGYRPGYEVVAEQILQLIAELALAPGDRLPTENELAARLSVSRTVVREAVKILSATGSVSAQKGRGLYVADGESVLGATRFGSFFLPTNLDHIFMLFEFRRVQEAEASRLAATRASPSELRVIETAVQTCGHGYQASD
ncbi:MAG: FadR/GntR family transcriptional regulator, partial [Streptosporangiaceae bacterium]